MSEKIRKFVKTLSCIRQRGSTSVAVAGLKNVPLEAVLIVHNEQEARRVRSQYRLPPHTVRSMGSHLEGINTPILIDKSVLEVVASELLTEIDVLEKANKKLLEEKTRLIKEKNELSMNFYFMSEWLRLAESKLRRIKDLL